MNAHAKIRESILERNTYLISAVELITCDVLFMQNPFIYLFYWLLFSDFFSIYKSALNTTKQLIEFSHLNFTI